MVRIRQLRWLALALAPLMLVTLFGCHGDMMFVVLLWLFGSWDGGTAQMHSPCGGIAFALTLITMALMQGVRSGEVDTAAASGDAELWANVVYNGHGPYAGAIRFAGDFQQDGNTVTVNLSAVSLADSSDVPADTITLDLTASQDQTLSGTITYVQGGVEFTGDVDFEKFPGQD